MGDLSNLTQTGWPSSNELVDPAENVLRTGE
jgi:hypothetical protein